MADHVLLDPDRVRVVEAAAAEELGRPWSAHGFDDLDDRASHPCGVFRGDGLGVFVKLGGLEQLTAELAGLALLREAGGVRTPRPVGPGVVSTATGALLLLEAVDVTDEQDWPAVGRTLATLHGSHAAQFGLDAPGWFGPLPQDNRPVPTNTWAEFYAERRVRPRLRDAVDRGMLPSATAAAIDALLDRLPALAGPEPEPTLLHGDAQQHNVLTTTSGVVLVDPAPAYGHPEADLALLDYFAPVPPVVLDAYRDLGPLDAGFDERRELWRLHAYLAVLAVDGHNPFGRSFLTRVDDALARYR